MSGQIWIDPAQARRTVSDKVVDAVVDFQKSERILVDGIWGPQIHSHARARIEAELVR